MTWNAGRRWMAGLWLLCVCWVGGAAGDVKPPEGSGGTDRASTPPSPQAMTITVVRGKPTPIELKAITKTTREVTFLLRSQPQAGELLGEGEIRRLPRAGEYNRGQVVYLAPDGGTEESDAFQFATRLGDGPISSAATVQIRIENPTPKLEFRKGYGFGSVQVGATVLARIQIRNVGTGPYRQELSVEAPWELVLDGGVLEIPEGQARELMVRYSPTEASDDRIEIPLDGEEDGPVLILTGEGAAPFLASPGHVVLAYDPEEGDRRGVVTLKNLGGHSQTVTVETKGNLKVAEDRVTMPPNGEVDVTLTLGGKTAYEGHVIFGSFTGYESKIAVESATLPARLEVVGTAADGVQLPKVLVGKRGEVNVEVKNVGGGEGAVIAEVSPPFSLREGDESFKILQGEQRTVKVGVETDLAGDHSGQLRLFCGDQIVSVVVLGSVVTEMEKEPDPIVGEPGGDPEQGAEGTVKSGGGPPPNLPGGVKRPSRPMTASERTLEAFLFHYGIGAKREYSKAVPQIASMRVAERTKTSLKMVWPEPEGGPYEYQIDIERLIRVPGYEGLLKFWVPFGEVKMKKAAGNVEATLTGLKPAANYRWRIATYLPGRGFSMPTRAFEVGTSFPRRIPWKWVLVGVGGVVAIGIWVWQRGKGYE